MLPKYKKIGRFYLPIEDTHLSKMKSFVEKGEYQTDTLRRAIRQCMRDEFALDIGANIGVMSYWMSKQFDRVTAFEPNPNLWNCFCRNTDSETVQLQGFALSDKAQDCHLEINKRHCGLGTIVPKKTDKTVVVRSLVLDEISFISKIDFIKIDVEGHEDKVIAGGKNTIVYMKPVIMLEEVEPKNTARKMLIKMGYKVVETIRNDHILIKEN